MSAQLIIELNDVRFFGEHGMYEEERRIGNEFSFDIAITSKAPKEKITTIDQTISYVEVYRIAQEAFAEGKQLLETCAMEIAEQLKRQFPEIREVAISIKKLNPPITSFSGTVGITYRKNFK